jgi:hypothetical protein
VCSEACTLLRYTRVISRCLQDVQSDDVIMACHTNWHGLQYHATVQHRVVDRSWPRLAKAKTQQDKGYVVNHMLRGGVDKIGRAGHRLASSSHIIYIQCSRYVIRYLWPRGHLSGPGTKCNHPSLSYKSPGGQRIQTTSTPTTHKPEEHSVIQQYSPWTYGIMLW